MAINEKELQQIRQEIDKLDNDLLPMLIKRFSLTHSVELAKLSQVHNTDKANISLKMLNREEEIVEGLRPAIIRWLESEKQNSLLQRHGFVEKTAAALSQLYLQIFAQALAFEQPQSVATLGPAGTWSQLATQARFGREIELNLCPDIPSVFDSLVNKSSMWAVLPYENSTNGPVNLTLDSFEQNNLQICGEFTVPIRHCLCGQSDGTPYVKRKRVYGHSQSIAQCGQWLRKNISNEIEMIPCTSNGQAILQAKQDSEGLALGSKFAIINDSNKDKLAIFAEGIDHAINQTRFVIISEMSTSATGQDKTSIKIKLGNQTGSLHTIMGILKDFGIDTSMLHSRPSKDTPWAYVFYMDINGHKDDKSIQDAMQKLTSQENLVMSLQVLGSYRKGLQLTI